MRIEATNQSRISTFAVPALCAGLLCFGSARSAPTDPGSSATATGDGALYDFNIEHLAADLSVSGDGELQPVPLIAAPELPPVASMADSCAEPLADDSMLERVRRRLAITACASSAWLDGLFGDQLRYDDYRATYGTVSLGTLWSQYDGVDPRLRFKLRLQLPQWDERISAFAGRVNRDEFISDSENDFDALPRRQFGSMAEDESVLVGLGYSSPRRNGNDFDVSVGVRVDLPLDPYVRTRWEMTRTFAESYVFSTRQSFFWQNSEGLGATTRLTLDRALSPWYLLRWSGLGKFTQETAGMEWNSQVTLFQSLNPRVGLAWQAELEGETDNEVQQTNRALRLIMRRQLNPEWLFLELRGGVEWPRRKLTEDREASAEVGIAFEMQFGPKRERNALSR
ncbi:MAG: hypothetical protein HC872_02995 [Gammaproteobacteria bacterium]|nr:hypothetical protein [Gammaproteobacteria bacterium]